MKHYDSIDNIKYNTELLGEQVWAFNKLDGQNFCAKYSVKKKMFTNFGSRKCMVDESSEQFGDAVRYFKSHNYENILSNISNCCYKLYNDMLYDNNEQQK